MYIFFLTVIIAPLLETLIYQLTIIEIVFKIKIKQANLIAILSSSFLFCLSHTYSIYYIFATFGLGAIFTTIYVVAKKREDINPFWFVVFIHFLNNLIAFVFNDLLKFR
ncbi:MAG: hypothetical protein COX71_06430 [Flavobacteriales bacterium CG_4_10_14_0_2_um_filter_35_18]|nr:MAG: hypothetical protein COX71_06430 [Flavobacteriales bacterium CG_4_10_14_0_2_um_filter_35_18]